MLKMLRSPLLRYGFAIASVATATLLRLALNPLLGETHLPYITYFPAVMLTAYICGLWPALLSVLLSALATAHFFVPPSNSIAVTGTEDLLGMGVFLLVGLMMALVSEAMHRAKTRVEAVAQALSESRERLSTTLSSIGDAVIATDAEGLVTFMNPVAQALTGWQMPGAKGQRLEAIFRIVNEETRREVESPFTRVIREDKVVGLANHTLLLAKDGHELPIDDSGAPIRDEKGRITGVVLVFHDITERRRSEAALRQSEERYRAFVENSSEAIWRCELEQPISIDLPEDEIIEQAYRYGSLAECNDVMAEMYGFSSAKEIVGARLDDLLVRSEPANLEYLRAFIRSGFRLTEAESQELDREGRRKYFLNNLVGIIENRMLLRAWGTQRDITQRKEAEATLRESEARFRRVVESNLIGVSFATLGGAITYANDAYLDMLGYTREEVEQEKMRWDQLTPPEYRHLDEQAIKEIKAKGACTPFEKEQIRKDGTRLPVLVGAAMLAEGEDNCVAFILDLTERKRTEEERAQLLEREQGARASAERSADRTARLQSITAALSEALTPVQVAAVVLSQGLTALGAHAGSVVLLNDQGTELELLDAVGFTQELVDEWRRFPLVSHLPLTQAVRTAQLVLIESLEARERWYPNLVALHTLTGNEALAAIPLVIEGRAVGAMGLSFQEAQEFSEEDRDFMLAIARQSAQAIIRARLYEAERRSRAEAEAANRTKDEFLATLSHELRTPLTAMLGWTRLLRTSHLDEPTTAHALETVERNARAQAQLIEDILDVSRIITGKLRLDMHPVELVPIIKAAVDAIRPAAEAKSIRLQTKLDPLAGVVSGDPARLQQVIWNLVANAVKFTGKGGQVEVGLERADSHLQITISDTGEGIQPEFLPFVFDRFRQADGSTTRIHGGLGLGLAIVRHLVELHGGTVRAESQGVGQGATFIIMLPLLSILVDTTDAERATTVIDGTQADRARLLSNLRVLVVDDEQDAREMLTVVLEQQGARVTAVTSAAEALAALRWLKPDVIVSDIGIPNTDGYTLMRKVRALPADEGGQIPAIALTAYAGENARELSLAAGFQVHLAKPIDPTELLAAIAGLVEK